MIRKVSLLLLGTLSLLTGCTGLNSDRYLYNKQTFLLNHGNPPAYVTGYIEGCSAGRRLAGDKRFVYKKNQTRFEKDALYTRGWQEGQINCRNEALAEQQGIMLIPTKKSPGKKVPTKEEKDFQEAEKAAEKELQEIWEELKK